MEIDKKNKQITAYHESGHAIVAYYTKDAMPINKATIMPRGPTLGHVSSTEHCILIGQEVFEAVVYYHGITPLWMLAAPGGLPQNRSGGTLVYQRKD